MNKLKFIGITFLCVISFIYLSFLFILPNVVNLNSYKADIDKLIKDNVALNVDYNSLNLYTHPALAVGVKADNISAKYLDDTNLAHIKNIDVRVDLIPLIFKKIHISRLFITDPEINVDIIDSNKYKFEDLFVANESLQKESANNSAPDINFGISLSNAKVNNYNIALRDVVKNNSLVLAGDYLNIDDFVLNKRVKLSSNGKILFNSNDNINFDINIDSFLPEEEKQHKKVQKDKTNDSEFVNIVDIFANYDFKSDINVDLKISSTSSGIKINGNSDIDKISFKLNNKRLPDSNINLKFDNQDAEIDSSFAIANNEKFNLKGDVNFGKKQKLNINCKSDKINLASIFNFVDGLLSSMAVDSGLNQFTESGYILADFNLDTDYKTIKSDGYLKIADGKIVHKSIPLNISDILFNIDFANNQININNSHAFVNGTKFETEGTINSNSELDIKAYTDKLPISSLLNSFAPNDLKKTYRIQDGLLSLNATIKGKFDSIIPKAEISLDNLSLKDVVNNMIISNKQIMMFVSTKDNAIDGKASIYSTNVRLSDYDLTIQNPQTDVIIGKNDIEIPQSQLFVNSSKLDFAGIVKNYLSKPTYDFALQGSLATSVLKKFVPSEYTSLIMDKGSLPVSAKVTGDLNKTAVNLQILANQNNYLTPITVNKLVNKSTVLNTDLVFENNNLILNDIAFYELTSNISQLNSTLANNILNAYRVAQVTGVVKNINGKVQTLNNIKLNLPAALSVSTSLSKNSKMLLKGGLTVNGTTLQPLISGNINISDLSLPEFYLSAGSIDVNLNDTNLNLKAENVAVENSKFNFELNAKPVFVPNFDIKSINILSSNMDTDRLIVISDELMKKFTPAPSSVNKSQSKASTTVASDNIPVIVRGGSLKIDKLTSGQLVFTGITSNLALSNNILKLSDLNLAAYGGNINGYVDYNLISTLINAKVKGSGIESNSFITAAAQLKDQIFGILAFNADVKLSGATYLEQVKSLSGNADFSIDNGKLGSLGSLENFLKAGNLASQKLISTTIGTIINTVAPYNSSSFKTMTGKLSFKNGVTNIQEIKSSGENMSLYIDGSMNLVNNNISATVLGRLSEKLSGALGPISSLSTDKLLASIPGVGNYALTLFKTFTISADESLLNKIPELTPNSDNTKSFKVVLSGNVEKPATVVKSFQWIETEGEYAEMKKNISGLSQSATELKEQAKDIVKTLLVPTEQSSDNNSQNTKQNKLDTIQKGVGGLLNLLSE